MRKRVLLSAVMTLCLNVIVASIAFGVGRKRGAVDNELARLPNDLVLYVHILELNEYIYGESETKPPRLDLGVGLHALLFLYDEYREVIHPDGLRPEQLVRLEKARRFVNTVELVRVGEGWRELLED